MLKQASKMLVPTCLKNNNPALVPGYGVRTASWLPGHATGDGAAREQVPMRTQHEHQRPGRAVWVSILQADMPGGILFVCVKIFQV